MYDLFVSDAKVLLAEIAPFRIPWKVILIGHYIECSDKNTLKNWKTAKMNRTTREKQ